jgi:hypothetical protein
LQVLLLLLLLPLTYPLLLPRRRLHYASASRCFQQAVEYLQLCQLLPPLPLLLPALPKVLLLLLLLLLLVLLLLVLLQLLWQSAAAQVSVRYLGFVCCCRCWLLLCFPAALAAFLPLPHWQLALSLLLLLLLLLPPH